MAVLHPWQRIDRVLTGKPFGDGIDGDVTLSSNPSTYATFTGTSGQNSGTVGASTFADGDLVFIHQTQKTGAGQWEINQVVSGGGTTSLSFKVALQYTYSSGAQIIKVPRYKNVTLSGYTIPAWNGSINGLSIICAQNSITGGGINGDGKGYRGCPRPSTNGTGGVPGRNGGYGEGHTGPSGGGNVTDGGPTSPNGNGGGGSGAQSNQAGLNHSSGGGGHAVNGGKGGGGRGAYGGSSAGTDDLTTLVLGGGSGAVGGFSEQPGSSGVSGGAAIILITKSLNINNSVSLNGLNGVNQNTWNGGVGGGAGGSILIQCENADISQSKLVSIGGTPSQHNNSYGGTGSVGRIAIHHSGTVTGTSNPAFYDQLDLSIKEAGNTGAFFNFL